MYMNMARVRFGVALQLCLLVVCCCLPLLLFCSLYDISFIV